MALVCSRCSNVFEEVSACPRCGAAAPRLANDPEAPGHGPRWQQTTPGRIVIGLVLAQGLFYALSQLVTGVMLVVRESPEADFWTEPPFALLLFALQMTGIFVGGIVVGGGQRLGFFLGALTGVWNGILAIIMKQHPGWESSPVVPLLANLGFLCQPASQAFFGCLGGALGGLIWRPIQAMVVPGALKAKKPAPPRGPSIWAGPIAPVRILFGTLIVVLGNLKAGELFQKILDIGGNALSTTTDFQDLLIIWEIKAILVLLGAGVAGSNTRNGFKQGFLVGALAAAILIGLQMNRATNVPAMIVYTVVGTVSLSTAGGWLGGQILPPVVKQRHRTTGQPSW